MSATRAYASVVKVTAGGTGSPKERIQFTLHALPPTRFRLSGSAPSSTRIHRWVEGIDAPARGAVIALGPLVLPRRG